MSERRWVEKGAANVGSCPFYEKCLYSGYYGTPSEYFEWHDMIYVLKGLCKMLCLKQILQGQWWRRGDHREGCCNRPDKG